MRAKKVTDFIQEGVADIAAEKLFNIPNETSKKSLAPNEELIARDGKWALIKNPVSMDSLNRNVRGVITKDGDVYMENFSEKIHHDLLKILFDRGIIKGEFSKKWNKQLPTESGFLTVQRYKDTENICIGESNRLLYDAENYDRFIPYYSAFIKKAQEKNTELKLRDKLVGMKFSALKEKSNIHSFAHNICEGKHFIKNNL
jgi:hypothetical protein